MEFSPVREAFVGGLAPQNKFFESTLAYVNSDIIRHRRSRHQFLDALLTVAAIPEHPYNARMLHRNLRSRPLPERDAWWSIWLNEQEGTEEPLTGSLIGFGTVATKPYKRRCCPPQCGRLDVVSDELQPAAERSRDQGACCPLGKKAARRSGLLREFLEVDDPYVTERLLAVAYGCAMRSADSKRQVIGAARLRLDFRSGSPPPNLLLRDHARGIIELALAEAGGIKIDEAKIRPPYRSEWPNQIPTQQELEKYKEWHEGMPDVERSRAGLYASCLATVTSRVTSSARIRDGLRGLLGAWVTGRFRRPTNYRNGFCIH